MADKERKILEMQFENRQFEKNIAKSQESVESLKQSMDFEAVSSGLKKFANRLGELDFSKLTDNLQKLTDKFTGLGTLSELVVSQVRHAIENVAAKISGFVSSMTTQQVSAGMSKFEMLNKSVQTIKAATGKDEKEVYSVLQRLNEYTDQTSYNFADMAQNIGKFTSVGIDLADAEKQMEGIANWAARSGAGINEASRAMYNLSQAMGVGKLTLIDWKSIENAGMATKEFKEQLIQAGVAAGTLKKETKTVNGQVKEVYKTIKGNEEVTYQNLGSTLQKGWATSKVLSATLERYYYDDLYYEHEQEQILKLNETQKASFDKMMESGNKLEKSEYETLSEMGVMTDETKKKILDLAVTQGKLEKKTDETGKTIYKTLNKSGKQIEFTLENMQDSLSTGWFDKDLGTAATSINNLARESYEAAQKCQTFTDVIGAWKDQISTGWMNSFKIIFGELSEAMEFFSNVCNKVGESLDELIQFRNKILQGWRDAGGRNSLIEALIGSSDTKEDAYGFLDILNDAKDLIYGGLVDFLTMFTNDPVMKRMMREDPEYLSAWLGYQAAQISNKVKSFMAGIKDFFNENVTVGGKTQTRLELIQDIISGISGALKLGYDVITGIMTFIGEIGKNLGPGFDELLGFLAELGEAIFNTSKEESKNGGKINKFFTDLAADLKPTTDSINELVTSILDLIRAIFGLEKGSDKNSFADTLSAIASVIRKVADVINKVASPIIRFLTNFVNAIQGFFKNGVNGETLKNFGKDLGNAFSQMMISFADALPKSLSFLTDWVHKLFGGGEKQVESAANSLFGKIGEVFKQGKQVNEEGKKEGQKSNNSGAGIMSLLTGTNVAVWVGVAALASVVLLLRKARKVVGAIGDFFWDLGKTLRKGIKVKYQDESFAKKFLKIGAAIALVAASVIALGSMPIDALIKGGIAVVAVIGIMFGLFKLLELSAKKGEYKDQLAFAAQVTALAFAMMALAVAVGILTLALVPFTLMSWDQYAKAMAGLGGILLQMVGFLLLLKLIKFNDISIVGLAGFAIGLGILVQAITPFAKMTWDQYAKAMAGLGGVLVEILGFMWAFKLLGLSTKALNFEGIVKFTFALAVLVFAIKPFAKMSWDQYAKTMAGLGGVLVEILAFMWLFKELGLSTKALNFNGIVKFTLAIAVLVLAIKPFASMSWEQYAKAMAGLGGVLVEILGFMWAFKELGLSTKALKFNGIIKFMLSIALLIQAIKPFANMTWEQYARAMAGLGGVLVEILGFMWLFKELGLSTKALNIEGFVLFVASIWLLVKSIMPFTEMDWGQYAKAMAGLGGTLAIMLGFMLGLKKLELDVSAIGGFVAFAASMRALVQAIMPFADMDWGQYAVTMVSFMSILGIMLGFMYLMKSEKLKPDIKGLLKMAVFVGIFAAVAGIFAGVLMMVKDIDWKVIVAFGAGLAVLIAVIGIASSAAQVLGPKGFAVLAAGIIMVLGAIALVAPLLITSISGGLRDAAADLAVMADLLETFSGKMNGIDEGGIDRAELMMKKMLGLFNNLIGFRMTASDTRQFMTAMSEMTLSMDELVKFNNRVKKLDADGGVGQATTIIEGLKTMCSTVLKDFGTYTTDSQLFYDVVYKLGSGFDYFNSMTANMTDPNDNKGLALIKELAVCAKDIDTIYKMDLDKLKRQLAELGGAMIIYAEGAASVEGKEITADTDIGGAIILLQKISSTLAENGGFAIPTDFPSEESITDFGIQLAALGGALVSFEKAGRDLGAGTDKALETLDFFYDLKVKLNDPKFSNFGNDLSGAINAFKGENGEFIKKDELTVFGEDIAQLGSSMKYFAEATQYVDKETGEVKPIDFSKATDALQAIVDLQHKLPAVGGVLQVIKGRKKTLTDLATEINLLGDALGEFYISTSTANKNIKTDAKTGEIEPLDFSNAIAFLNAVGDLETKLPEMGGVVSWITGRRETLGEVGAELVQLGSGIKLFYEKINETNANVETDAKTGEVKSLGLDDVIKLMNAIGDLKEKLPEMGGVASWITGRKETLGEVGTELVGLGTGMKTFSDNILGTGESGKPAFDADACKAALDFIDQSVLPLMLRIGVDMPAVGGVSQIISTLISGRQATISDVAGELQTLGPAFGALNDGLYATESGLVEKGEDGHAVFNKDLMDDAIDMLNTGILPFMRDLRTQMPRVGGIAETVYSLINGRYMTITDVAGELSALGPALGALGAGLNATENGLVETDENGHASFNKTLMTDAIDILSTGILPFMRDLRVQMPRVGGIGETLKNIVEGRAVTLTDLAGYLEDLGNGLGTLGKGLNATESGLVSTNAEGQEVFNTQLMNDAISMLSTGILPFMRDLRTQLPHVGGIAETLDSIVWGRAATLTDLSTELEAFGSGLGALGKGLNDVENGLVSTDESGNAVFNSSLAQSAINMVKDCIIPFMRDIRTQFPRVGGLSDTLYSLIDGRAATLTDVSKELSALGTGLGKLGKGLNDVENGLVEKDKDGNTKFNKDLAKEAIDMINTVILPFMRDLRTQLPRVGGLSNTLQSILIGRGFNLEDLGTQLTGLGKGLAGLGVGFNDAENGLIGTNDKGEKVFDEGLMGSAIDMLEQHVIPFMQHFADDLPTIGGLKNVINTFINGRAMDLKDLGEQIGKLGPGLGELGKGLSQGGWNTDFNYSSAFDVLDSIVSIMIRLSKVDEMFGSVAYADFTKLVDLVHFLAYGISAEENVYQGTAINPITDDLAAFMKSLSDAVGGFAKTDKELETIKKRIELFKTFMEGLSTLTGMDMTGNWATIGTKMTSELATSIANGMEGVITASKDLMTSSYDASSTVVTWSTLGENITLGITAGVNSKKETDLYPAVEAMMKEAYRRGKEAIQSNSPSKLFMELGEYMGEGTAIGLKKTTDDVGENAGTMGEVALDKAKAMVALISTVMAEDMNAHPTISPVLDLTNIETGMQTFRNNLGRYGIALDTSNLAARAGKIGTSAYADESAMKPDYSGLYQRMEQMSSQMTKMGESIRQMKIVLNTGALVGGVSDGIDIELGRRSFYAERNN